MSKSPVRRIALELLQLAETSTHPLPELLERKGLELEAAGAAGDQGLLRHLVLGTLRHRGTLDALLAAASRRPLDSLNGSVRNLLRLGAFQLSPESRIPPHAAVSESVRLAKRLGHAGIASFVNAVLRNVARRGPQLLLDFADPVKTPDAIDRISLTTSHPRWLVERWSGQLGLEAAQIRCQQNNLEAPVDLRVNLARMSFEDGLKALRQMDLETVPLDTDGGLRLVDSSGLRRVLGLRADRQRAFYVQSRMSQIAGESAARLACEVLAARPGGTSGAIVLDACAAPGGKSLVLSQGLPSDVRLVAYDSSDRRRRRLRKNLAELGALATRGPGGKELTQDSREEWELLPSEPAREASGTKPSHANVELVDNEEDLVALEGRCSFILVDAPCTALGVLRRHPEIRWRRTPEDPARLGEMQAELLHRFSRFLEPGGALLYAVCSFEPEETEAPVSAVLRDGFLQRCEIPGVGRYAGLTPTELGVASFGQESGEDGYFLSAFKRAAPC